MKCPQHLSKTTLLTAVDELNEVGAKLRLKSKTSQFIVDAVAAKIKDMNHFEIIEALSDTALAELTAWGIVEGFISPDDIQDGLQKTLDLIEDNEGEYYQASEIVTFDESFLPVRPEWAKWEDALSDPDISNKKRKKLEAKIEKCKAQVEKEEEERAAEKKKEAKPEKEPKAKPEPKADPELIALESTLAKAQAKGKKKKIAKAQKALDTYKEANPAPKKDKAPKKAKGPKTAGPGIILSIITCLKDSKKYMTHEEIATCVAEIVGREPDTIIKTIKAQLGAKAPTRLEKEKGITIDVQKGDTAADRSYRYSKKNKGDK